MEGKEKKRSRARGGRAEEYLDALCRQIHWKSYRKAIRDELKDHIEDASSEMRKKGLSADQALEKALCDLGDPAETGRKLNRIYRPSWNKSWQRRYSAERRCFRCFTCPQACRAAFWTARDCGCGFWRP